MSTIDFSPHLNVARDPALAYAKFRANQTRTPKFVFVGGPNCESPLTNDLQLNIWYVRNSLGAKPAGAELYQIVQPDA